MISLYSLGCQIYYNLDKLRKVPRKDRYNATVNYMLNEITQWSIKKGSLGRGLINFKPVEFKGDDESNPFEVRLNYDPQDQLWDLKFGDLTKGRSEDKFKYNDDDKYKLQKALFLRNVLENEVYNLLESGEIKGIKFQPYDGDGLGDERYIYFKHMFDKLNKDKYNLIKTKDYDGDEIYKIIKK